MRQLVFFAGITLAAGAMAAYLHFSANRERAAVPLPAANPADKTTPSQRSSNPTLETLTAKLVEAPDGKTKRNRNKGDPLKNLVATDGTPAPKFEKIIFNELMVKSALAFAREKTKCKGSSCDSGPVADIERLRIFRRIQTDARTACQRRQLKGCAVKAELHFVEKDFAPALLTLKDGRRFAGAVVSRCESGKEKDGAVCEEGQSFSAQFEKMEKDIRVQMLK